MEVAISQDYSVRNSLTANGIWKLQFHKIYLLVLEISPGSNLSGGQPAIKLNLPPMV